MPEFNGSIASVAEPERSKAGDKWKTALIEVDTGGEYTKKFRVWPYEGDALNPVYVKAKELKGQEVVIDYYQDTYKGSRGPVTQNMVTDLWSVSESRPASNGSQGASNGSGAVQTLSAAAEQRVREIIRQELLSWEGAGGAPSGAAPPTPDYDAFLSRATEAGVSEKFIEAQYKAIGGDGASWRQASEQDLIVLEEKLGIGF